MRKYLLFSGFLLIVVLMTSCRPKGVLSRKEMTDLLFDVHIAEALTNQKIAPVPDDWRRGLEPDYFRDMSYQSVLRKHDVTEANFYKSVRYYSKDLRMYTRIYADVEKRIRTFSQDVTDWKYNKPSAEEFYQKTQLDTAKIRALFSEQHFCLDTSKIEGYSIVPDSVVSWLDWKTREWLRERKQKQEQFYVINPKDYVKISDFKVDSISADSSDKEKYDGPTLPKDQTMILDNFKKKKLSEKEVVTF